MELEGVYRRKMDYILVLPTAIEPIPGGSVTQTMNNK
jgi:hypothetical protein